MGADWGSPRYFFPGDRAPDRRRAIAQSAPTGASERAPLLVPGRASPTFGAADVWNWRADMKTTVSDRSAKGWVRGWLALAALVASCSSTNMTSTWTDPAAKGAAMSRIAVICLTRDPGLRRMAEDTAASHMANAQAIPSYQLLSDTDLQDRETVKSKLRAAGVNGVLVMRMAGVSERVSPADYGSFDRYYGYAGTTVYGPGYAQTDTIVHVVSNLYSLDQNKLVWSGVSQTFDPASAREFMTSVSKEVAKSLQKDRLIL
jgi:hypothetical protein